MKGKRIIALIAFVSLLSSCGVVKNALTTTTTAAPVETTTTTAETTTETTAATAAPAEHRTGDEIVGVSDKDITEFFSTFYDTVRNDTTGGWKCLVIAANIDIKDYALSAYNNYYGDAKLLVVENLTTKTCAVITKIGTFLDVTVHEYIDGEEHDANVMASGEVLAQYWVYLDNGDIEKI